jgi:hypothetical protein
LPHARATGVSEVGTRLCFGLSRRRMRCVCACVAEAFYGRAAKRSRPGGARSEPMRRGQQSSWLGLVFVFMVGHMLSYNYGWIIDSLAELCQRVPRRKSNKKDCWRRSAVITESRYLRALMGAFDYLRRCPRPPRSAGYRRSAVYTGLLLPNLLCDNVRQNWTLYVHCMTWRHLCRIALSRARKA